MGERQSAFVSVASDSPLTTFENPSEVSAYAAMGAGETLQPYRFALGELGPAEIEVAISHCGICHSDWHLIHNDWGVSVYPLVPGHEIVGTVTRLGREVKNLRVGQRVGVGWLAGACMRCESCLGGNENLCRQAQPTCVKRHGGYATAVIVDYRFAAPIADELASEFAAPLLCAGVTVFAPLRRQRLVAGARVGVVGVGGLGHLAIQFAAAMDCAVTAFSDSPAKEAEARACGADRFVATHRQSELARAAATCDFILSTVPVDLPWSTYLDILKPNGQLCIVGASPGEVRASVFALIDGQKSIAGSAVGSNAEIRATLEFAVAHGLRPMVELFALDEVNVALDRLRRNQLRYRAVLVHRS